MPGHSPPSAFIERLLQHLPVSAFAPDTQHRAMLWNRACEQQRRKFKPSQDCNGNGLIDSGRELFGDSTLKSSGQQASDGFDALTDLDSNHNGVVNSSDTEFGYLLLWRDLSQDGVSQSGELFTLTEAGIAGILQNSYQAAQAQNKRLVFVPPGVSAQEAYVALYGDYLYTDAGLQTTGG